MRLIEHAGGRIRRRPGADPQAETVYLVDQQGSAALIDGKLYLNGQPAPQGIHRLALDGGDALTVTVTKAGKVSRKLEKGGATGGQGI